MNIFGGMMKLWIFLWGLSQILTIFWGVISIHFRDRYTIGIFLANFHILCFGVYLVLLIFFGKQ